MGRISIDFTDRIPREIPEFVCVEEGGGELIN